MDKLQRFGILFLLAATAALMTACGSSGKSQRSSTTASKSDPSTSDLGPQRAAVCERFCTRMSGCTAEVKDAKDKKAYMSQCIMVCRDKRMDQRAMNQTGKCLRTTSSCETLAQCLVAQPASVAKPAGKPGAAAAKPAAKAGGADDTDAEDELQPWTGRARDYKSDRNPAAKSPAASTAPYPRVI